MQKIMACVGIVGVMVVGAMSKDMFWASLPIAIGQGDSAQTLQDILDGIMPGMLGMAAFWLSGDDAQGGQEEGVTQAGKRTHEGGLDVVDALGLNLATSDLFFHGHRDATHEGG